MARAKKCACFSWRLAFHATIGIINSNENESTV
jgi:hypothetical protein